MKYIFITLVILLSGCTSTSKAGLETDVMQLIKKTAEVAPEAVNGEYVFTVQAAGEQNQMVYLNTELDYRDRRNISIALFPRLASYIENQYGMLPQEYFLNKKVKVKGEAKQVKIWFYSNGKRSSKYYYQTQIRIRSPKQIEVIG